MRKVRPDRRTAGHGRHEAARRRRTEAEEKRKAEGRKKTGKTAAPPRAEPDGNGYLSEANLAAMAARRINAYVAIGRAKHPAKAKRKIVGPLTSAMRSKIKRAG